jgi:Terminase large subunit, T4likevirus-type, N-terminal
VERQPNASWAVGRRGGKSKCSAAVGLFDLLFRPDLDELIEEGGERVSVCVATNRRQATIVLNEAKRFTRHSVVAKQCLVHETAEELIFQHNGRRKIFLAAPASGRGIRGRAYSTGILDECAYMYEGDADSDQNVAALFRAIYGGVAEFGSLSRMLIISSPKDDRGWFAKHWQWANSGEDPSWWAAQVPTAEMNPNVDRNFLAMVKRTQPEMYPAEFDAQFISGGASMFDRTRFSLNAGLSTAEPSEATRWVCGLDPAISGDAFGVAMLGQTESGTFVLGPCQAFEHEHEGSWSAESKRDAWQSVLGKVATVCREYDAEVFSDQHESQVVTEMLARFGVACVVIGMNGKPRDEFDNPMEGAGNVKYASFIELRDSLYSGKLPLPVHEDLRDEILGVQLKIDSSGPRVILPRSSKGHRDLAQALALATYALTRRSSMVPAVAETIRYVHPALSASPSEFG